MGYLHAINLDEQGEKFWKVRFNGKRDFSSWIQEKLREDFDQFNENYWIHSINENRLIMEKATMEMAHAQRQLDKLKENDEVKRIESINNPKAQDKENIERQLFSVSRSIGMRLQYHFIVKPLPPSNVFELLANEYLKIKLEERPELNDYLASKGYIRKEIKKKDVTL